MDPSSGYPRRTNSSVSRESDDEKLARQLQEEEQRSMGSHAALPHGMEHLSAQEREDMMLARRMANMDMHSGGSNSNHSNNSGYGGMHSNGGNRSAGYPSSYSSGSAPSSGASGGVDDRLAYARRLQEQAFQRMQGNSQPLTRQTTEEKDLELAMKMQIEESSSSTPATMDQEDEDMKLARFMEESGVSIRDLDEEGVEALKQQALRGGLGGPSLGMGGPPPRGGGLGGGLGGGGGGGMLGGMYGGGRRDDDDSDEDSIDFAGPSPVPPARSVPSSMPPARAVPSSIPPAAGRSLAAGIPLAVPPVASLPSADSRIAPSASASASALKPAPRSPVRRQLPAPSKSSGPGTSPGAGGTGQRRLPTPSKSFGGGNRAGLPSRNSPPKTHSGSLESLRRALPGDRSVSPPQGGRRGHAHKKSPLELGAPLMGDLPPGVNMLGANVPENDHPSGGVEAAMAAPAKKEKKKGGKLLKRIFGGKHHDSKPQHNVDFNKLAEGIPSAIPAPPQGEAGPLPHSVAVNRNIAQNVLGSSTTSQEKKAAVACSVCGIRTGKMVAAMDKRFHPECFRCMSCNELIDPSSVFAVSIDPMGEQQPLHRKCYAEFYGVQCAVCKRSIPANYDGSVSFIKHPFFSTEQMCPSHANDNKRRCTGCHRFEPDDEPFANLNDGNRCVCYACCRTVIMNNEDVKPLWLEVLRFFEFQLGLPIWDSMKEIPILVVDQAALNETQLNDGTSAHGDSSQIMTRGICLSEHERSRSFRVPSLRFNDSTCSFEACNHATGFMNLEVMPKKSNSHSEVTAILCLSGLPRDLTASVLAHEATHAWIKLHPDFKVRKMLPAQVEEGCAQLVAYLFLCDGLEPPRRHSVSGPSDEKLRQYFKFSIETDDNDIYGEGYRKAAAAYASIGIQGLLDHVVHHQSFPPP